MSISEMLEEIEELDQADKASLVSQITEDFTDQEIFECFFEIIDDRDLEMDFAKEVEERYSSLDEED